MASFERGTQRLNGQGVPAEDVHLAKFAFTALAVTEASWDYKPLAGTSPATSPIGGASKVGQPERSLRP